MNKDDFIRFFEYYKSKTTSDLYHAFWCALDKRGWVIKYVQRRFYPYRFCDHVFYNKELNLELADVIHFNWELNINWSFVEDFCSTYLSILDSGEEEEAHEYLCHLSIVTPDLDANDMYNLYIRLTQIPISRI